MHQTFIPSSSLCSKDSIRLLPNASILPQTKSFIHTNSCKILQQIHQFNHNSFILQSWWHCCHLQKWWFNRSYRQNQSHQTKSNKVSFPHSQSTNLVSCLSPRSRWPIYTQHWTPSFNSLKCTICDQQRWTIYANLSLLFVQAATTLSQDSTDPSFSHYFLHFLHQRLKKGWTPSQVPQLSSPLLCQSRWSSSKGLTWCPLWCCCHEKNEQKWSIQIACFCSICQTNLSCFWKFAHSCHWSPTVCTITHLVPQ